jgi:hypothetical protein
VNLFNQEVDREKQEAARLKAHKERLLALMKELPEI